jgi:hypothetical protein
MIEPQETASPEARSFPLHELRTTLRKRSALAPRSARRHCIGTALALLCLVLPALGQQSESPFPIVPPQRQGAVIQGRVLDAQGKPVFGVSVFTSRLDGPPSSPLTTARVQTGIDGYFTLDGLAPSTYRLCVDPQGKQFLDPCEWSTEPLTVQLEENGIIHDIPLPLEAADLVTIEVEDPTDALGKLAATLSPDPGPRTTDPGASFAAAPAESLKPAGNLLLGLRTRTGALSPARLATTDKQSKKLRYIVPAPKATDLDLLAMPINLELRDKANTPLASRGSLTRLTKAQREQKPASSPVLELSIQKKVNP